MSGKCGPTCRRSPSPPPTTGRFSRSSGLANRRSTSRANISAKCPTSVRRQVPRCPARRRQGQVIRAICHLRATTESAIKVPRARILPQEQAPHALCEPQGLPPPASSKPPTRCSAPGRYALKQGPEHPRLQGDVGPRRMAGHDRNARREPSARCRLTAEILIPQTKTGFYKNRAAPLACS